MTLGKPPAPNPPAFAASASSSASDSSSDSSSDAASSSDADTVDTPSGVLVTMATGRVEAFSDGVIAVGATLLVLNMKVPAPDADILSSLQVQIPAFATYVTSFLTILIFWVNHHALFHTVDRVDRPMLFLNGLLLLAISLISYSTSILGRSLQSGHQANEAAVLYALTLVAASACFTSLWGRLARRDHLLTPGARHRATAALRRSLIGPSLYLLSAGVACFSAPGSLFLDVAIAGYFSLLPRHLRQSAAVPIP